MKNSTSIYLMLRKMIPYSWKEQSRDIESKVDEIKQTFRGCGNILR